MSHTRVMLGCPHFGGIIYLRQMSALGALETHEAEVLKSDKLIRKEEGNIPLLAEHS